MFVFSSRPTAVLKLSLNVDVASMRHLLVLSVLVSSLVGSGCTSKIDRETAQLCGDMGWTNCGTLSIWGTPFESKVAEMIQAQIDLKSLAVKVNKQNETLINDRALAAINEVSNRDFQKAMLSEQPFDGLMKLDNFGASRPLCHSFDNKLEKKCEDEGVRVSTPTLGIYRVSLRLVFVDPSTSAGKNLVLASRSTLGLNCGLSASGELKFVPSTGEYDKSVGWWRVNEFSMSPCSNEILLAKLTRVMSNELRRKFTGRTKLTEPEALNWRIWFLGELESVVNKGVGTTTSY